MSFFLAICSDSSIASANSLSKPMYYQDQAHAASRDSRTAATSPNSNADNSIPSCQIQIQQVHDSYAVAPQLDQQQQQPQQQFMQASMHYIPHPNAPAPVQMSSYYPVYASPSQQQQLHHPADQQYSAVYVMQPQPFMSMQSNNAGVITMKSNATDAITMAPSRPLTPTPPPAMVAASTASPVYPTNTATLAKPHEMTATVYRTAMPANHQVVQVQQPYAVGYSQMQHPPQSAAAPPSNYGYEYTNPTQDQIYYAQRQTPPLPPPQYQTMTQAAAAAVLADASMQMPTDSR